MNEFIHFGTEQLDGLIAEYTDREVSWPGVHSTHGPRKNYGHRCYATVTCDVMIEGPLI